MDSTCLTTTTGHVGLSTRTNETNLGHLQQDKLALFHEFINAGNFINYTDVFECYDAIAALYKSNSTYQNDPSIQSFMRTIRASGVIDLPTILGCIQHKDNAHLTDCITATLENAGDLQKYPPGHGIPDRCSVQAKRLEFASSPYAYTFFVDRDYSDMSKFPHDKRAYGERTYGENMFSNDERDCSGDYLQCGFEALAYLYDCGLNFSECDDYDALFSTLESVNRMSRGTDNSWVLNTGTDYASNPVAHLPLFYNLQTNVLNKDYFSSSNIGNRFFSPRILHPHVWALATATNGITELQSGFPNEQTIRAYFAEDVANYQNRIREANNEDEKIAAIILFISIVEGSHFFDNGNNRLCCQILINKLLKEQGLDPTILFIPNGFSHYVLGILPWEVRLGLVELNEVPLEILTARLKPALMMVKEGEDFYRAVCTAGNSSTVVYTESANNV